MVCNMSAVGRGGRSAAAPAGDVRYWLRGLGNFVDESGYNVTTSKTAGYVNCRDSAAINGTRCIELYTSTNNAIVSIATPNLYTRLDPTIPFTYEFYVYPSGSNINRSWIISNGGGYSSNPPGSFEITISPTGNASNCEISFYDDNGDFIDSFNVPRPPLNTISFYRIAYDGVRTRVYFNGVLATTSAVILLTKLNSYFSLSASSNTLGDISYVDDLRFIAGVALGAGYP